MLDASRLLRLLSSKLATGLAVAALAAGAGTVGVMAAAGGNGASSSHHTTTSTTTPGSTHGNSHGSQTSTGSSSSTTTSSTTSRSSSSTDKDGGQETVTESSETGDNDAHGDAVRQAVIACKAAAAKAGTHGIGHCVSKVASSNPQH